MTTRKTALRLALTTLAALTLLPALPACNQRNLFAESDPAARKIKYYRDGESAEITRANRKTAADMGFGMSQGAAPQ